MNKGDIELQATALLLEKNDIDTNKCFSFWQEDISGNKKFIIKFSDNPTSEDSFELSKKRGLKIKAQNKGKDFEVYQILSSETGFFEKYFQTRLLLDKFGCSQGI